MSTRPSLHRLAPGRAPAQAVDSPNHSATASHRPPGLLHLTIPSHNCLNAGQFHRIVSSSASSIERSAWVSTSLPNCTARWWSRLDDYQFRTKESRVMCDSVFVQFASESHQFSPLFL